MYFLLHRFHRCGPLHRVHCPRLYCAPPLLGGPAAVPREEGHDRFACAPFILPAVSTGLRMHMCPSACCWWLCMLSRAASFVGYLFAPGGVRRRGRRSGTAAMSCTWIGLSAPVLHCRSGPGRRRPPGGRPQRRPSEARPASPATTRRAGFCRCCRCATLSQVFPLECRLCCGHGGNGKKAQGCMRIQ